MEYAIIKGGKIIGIVSTNSEPKKNWKKLPKDFDIKIGTLESWVDWEKGKIKTDEELIKMDVKDFRGAYYDENGKLHEITELGVEPDKKWTKEKRSERKKRSAEEKKKQINEETELGIKAWCLDQGKSEFWFLNQGIQGGKDDKDYKKYTNERKRLIEMGRDKKDKLIYEADEE